MGLTHTAHITVPRMSYSEHSIHLFLMFNCCQETSEMNYSNDKYKGIMLLVPTRWSEGQKIVNIGGRVWQSDKVGKTLTVTAASGSHCTLAAPSVSPPSFWSWSEALPWDWQECSTLNTDRPKLFYRCMRCWYNRNICLGYYKLGPIYIMGMPRKSSGAIGWM